MFYVLQRMYKILERVVKNTCLYVNADLSHLSPVSQLGMDLYKGKAIPLQTLTGPEGSRRLRLPDFKTIST
jgi:hypothetical protein